MGKLHRLVKRRGWILLGKSATRLGVAKSSDTETLDDLLGGRSLESFAAAAGITRRTLFAARNGGPVSRITVAKIAAEAGVSVVRVRAAIKRSKAAK
jgi:hypothetical protein